MHFKVVLSWKQCSCDVIIELKGVILWICTRVKVQVIDNKTTWVRVKSTGGKTQLSKR
jgi:hypothetical protein